MRLANALVHSLGLVWSRS